MASESPIDEQGSRTGRDTEQTTPEESQSPQQLFPPSTLPTEPDVPPSPSCYQITCKAEKDKYDRVKFWAEMVVGFFVITYTIVSVGLWCEARRASIEAHNSLEEAQRQNDLQNVQWGLINGIAIREDYFSIWKFNQTFVRVKLVNKGPQKAKRIAIAGYAQIRNEAPSREDLHPDPEEFKIPGPEERKTGPPASDIIATILLLPDISDEIRADYVARKKNLYVWGRIVYNDGVRDVSWDFCKYATADQLPNLESIAGYALPNDGSPLDCRLPWVPRFQEIEHKHQ